MPTTGPSKRNGRIFFRIQATHRPRWRHFPFGKVAYVLMISCGLETCTAIHLPEETIAVDIYVRPHESGALYHCRDRQGTVHEIWARRHWSLNRNFPKFAPDLAAQGRLRTGEILGCPYTIVSLRALLRHVFAALITDPRATLGDV